MAEHENTAAAVNGQSSASRSGIDDDETVYQVVVNQEEQYSIWPGYRGNPPAGWRAIGVSGNKSLCLAHINQVWTDMRPVSLRRRMEEAARQPAAQPVHPVDESPERNLVEFLEQGEHRVEASLRPERSASALKAALDRGYVHLKFTGTRGGTELGVQLDVEHSRLDRADFATGSGAIHLEGTLELDGVDVRCIADLDLAQLAGNGWLQRVGGPARTSTVHS